MKASDIEDKPLRPPRKKRGTKPKITGPEARANDRKHNVFINESFKIPITRELSKSFKRDKDKYKRYGYNREYLGFNKLFITEYTKAKIAGLSLRAKELYLHVVYNLQAGNSKIEINKAKYMLQYDVKATTFSNTRTELMVANIILDVKKERDFYWINPFYFYNGNRLKTFEPFLDLHYNYANDDYEKELEKIRTDYWDNLVKNENKQD